MKKVKNSIARAWFEEALHLEPEQSLYIQAQNKKEQKSLGKDLALEKIRYSEFYPVEACCYTIFTSFKDGRLWVIIKKSSLALPAQKALVKDELGNFKEIQVGFLRKRRLTLMLQDGLSKEEIAENLGGLTTQEEEEFFS